MKTRINLNDIDLAVAEYLKDQGIDFKAIFTGTKTDENWQRDQFTVTIKPKGKYSESFEFNQGIGNRLGLIGTNYKLTQSQIDSAKKLKDLLNVDSVLGGAIVKLSNDQYVIAPTQASVLYCLLLDAQAADQNFDDFCSDLGYNPDSRKDFKIYEACCETLQKIRKLFTNEQRVKLAELLQDY